MSVEHDRFTLRRELAAPPGRVFAAWADRERKARWFAEGDGEYELDFCVGGTERNVGATPGGPHYSYTARFSDIVEGERIVYTYEMHRGEVLISVSLVSVLFEPAGQGTLMSLTEELAVLDGADRTEYRTSGVGSQLDRLAELFDQEEEQRP